MEGFQTPGAFASACPGYSAGAAGLLFSSLIQSLIVSQCGLGGSNEYPKDYGDQIKNGDAFDFIVIGAGSAGSAVASRLSENPDWNVLLLEAGGDPTFDTVVPGFTFTCQKTDIDWKYRGETSKRACLGTHNSQCPFPRGKVLGGSSTINALLYVRGNKKDYDEWEELGNPGWGYKDVLPFFKKLENFGVDDEYHSSKGPMTIEKFPPVPQLEAVKSIICGSFGENGVPGNDDFSGESQIGCGQTHATVSKGTRANTARMYLSGNRKNLVVVKNALVEKITVDGGRAVGVLYSRAGKTMAVRTRKEIILSGGAIGSPHLLLLSGIGSKEDLKEVGVSSVQDLPGVGKNFQDHLMMPLTYLVNEAYAKTATLEVMQEWMLEYLRTQTGMLSGIGITDVFAFVDTVSGSEVPDVQFHMVIFPKGGKLLSAYTQGVSFRQGIADQILEMGDKADLFVLFPTLLRPKSFGEIFLISANASDHPIIRTNFLTEAEDVESLIRGIRLAERVVTSANFSLLSPKKSPVDLPACESFEEGSDMYWECAIRHMAHSVYHPVGTCKMGPSSDVMAVVDHRLRVHGIEGLRVADGSIMPYVTRANTNIPCIMIGEKAAEMIKEDWTRERNEL